MTLLVCLITAGVSFLAFQRPAIRDRLLFRPESILAQKEWYRLFSCALIHANWSHLAFNLLALFSFGIAIETVWGAPTFLGIYGASILGGSLLSLFLHRHHDYAALGASGGVCGVMFASIFLVPGTSVSLMFLPIGIPGPIFAIAYLVGTFWALRQGVGNIGHDAHFGGAIVGLVLAALIAPENCRMSPVLFTASFVFAVFCLFVLARDPLGITGKTFSFGKSEYRSNIRYQHYDQARARRQAQAEVDRLLDKVAAQGLHSLTPRERATLDDFSARSRRG